MKEKEMKDNSYTDAISILNTWRKGAFEGLYESDVLILLDIIKHKIKTWEHPIDEIDGYFYALGAKIVVEVERIIKDETLSKAVSNRF